jgi:hypothetical protein
LSLGGLRWHYLDLAGSAFGMIFKRLLFTELFFLHIGILSTQPSWPFCRVATKTGAKYENAAKQGLQR